MGFQGFATNAELKSTVKYFNTPDIIAKYGPILDWDVSKITDMSVLFKDIIN